MAKFGKFDPKNKKKRKDKYRSERKSVRRADEYKRERVAQTAYR